MATILSKKILKKVFEFFLPRRCVVCNSILHDGESVICSQCLLHDGMSGLFPDSSDNLMVRSVLGFAPIIRANALIEFHPHGLQAGIIYKMKYKGRSDIAVNMGRHAAKALLPVGFFDGIDVIVPVPITRMRRFQRGYNKSEMFARGMSEVTSLPVDTTSIIRHRFHRSQTRLNLEQRRNNVANAFRLVSSASLSHKHVLVVDDIFTTGATLGACLREISQHATGVRLSILTLGLTKS